MKVEISLGNQFTVLESVNDVMEDFKLANESTVNLTLLILSNDTKDAYKFLFICFDPLKSVTQSIWDCRIKVDDIYEFACYIYEVDLNCYIKAQIGKTLNKLTEQRLGFSVVGEALGIVRER